MKYLALPLALLLTGCATIDDIFGPAKPPKIVNSRFILVIQETPELPMQHPGKAMMYDFGPARDKMCVIDLRRYPVCLLHEIRHCIEGDWHGAFPNGDDC
jgi:hypothetical protein